MRLLYLNAGDFELSFPRKLAGIRRYAKTCGWSVEAFRRRDVPTSEVPGLLRRFRPFGCIVEDTDPHQHLPPGLFRGMPVVYLDPSNPSSRRYHARVLCDQEAVSAAAFRELAAGNPPSYAVVPSLSLPPWNRRRIAEFSRLCSEAGKPCHVFDGRRDEELAKRAARLGAWLAALPPHTAIFATNDYSARGVSEVAASLGLGIPDRFTLVGVDAIPESITDSTAPRVSSVELDFELAGYLAAKALAEELKRVEGTPVPRPPDTPPSFGPLLVLRRESTRGRGRRVPHVMKAVEIIRREACEGLTAAALSSRLPGSRKHFERRFREAMGHSVLDEILHVRLGMVLDLLSRPGMSITAIADFCGFGTQRGLRKLFRSRFGMSMEEWRKEHGLR